MNVSLRENEQVLIQCDVCGKSCHQHMWSEHIHHSEEIIQTITALNTIDVQEERSDENSDENDCSHTDNVYPCLECGKIYKSRTGMTRHVKIHHSYGKGFNCKICLQCFATKLLLKTHIEQKHHEDANVIKCSVCDKVFPDKTSLSKHFKSHRSDRPFKCLVCNKTYKEKHGLDRHEKVHLKIREHNCDECGKSFFRPRDLKLHMERHSDLKPFKCNFCEKTFRTNANLRLHTKYHTNPHKFECFVCEKKFAIKHGLNRHLITHRQKKQFPCSQCHKAYHFQHRLERHVKASHNKERPYECEICKKLFASKDNLKIHLRVHNNEKPYPCSICSRAFSQASNKIRHELTHKAIKKFQCLICSKGFYTQYELKQHTVIHQTPSAKPFKCTECDKQFVKANSLKLHVERTHLGIRYTCTICNKTYKVAFNYRQHMKKHENEPTEGNDEKQNKEIPDHEGSNQEEQIVLKTQEGVISNSSKEACGRVVLQYSCGYCSQSFYQEQDMIKHIDNMHKELKCEYCKILFTTESGLETHTCSCTKSEKGFICSACGNTFCSNASLKRHMEIHSNGEPVQCLECERTFRNERLLKRHQLIHSDNRPFKCNTCEKAFRRRDDLVKHTRTHTGEAPYKCRYCERTFKQSNNCQRHEKTHKKDKRCFTSGSEIKDHVANHKETDGKYFKCHICDKGFSNNKNLKAHITNVHVNPKYSCNSCDKRFPTARELGKHKKTHVEECLLTQQQKDNASEVGLENEVADNIRENVARQGDTVIRNNNTNKQCDDESSKPFSEVLESNRPGEGIQNGESVNSTQYRREVIVEQSVSLTCSNENNVCASIGRKNVESAKGREVREEARECVEISSQNNETEEIMDDEKRVMSEEQVVNDDSQEFGRDFPLEKDRYVETTPKTGRDNEESNEAIRKILEGKPFICPECDKRYASRTGLKYHYMKAHQDIQTNTTHDSTKYYCYECKEGFKTKKKFWLHDIKIHGLMDTSSDESDSEVVAGRERNITVVGVETVVEKEMQKT